LFCRKSNKKLASLFKSIRGNSTITHCMLIFAEPRQLKFNGRRLLCHPSFRVILSTKYASFSCMSPLISSATTLIDFAISDFTVTELLIRRAVVHIQPKLRDQHRALASFVRSCSTLLDSKSVKFQENLRHISKTLDRESFDEISVYAIMQTAQEAVQVGAK